MEQHFGEVNSGFGLKMPIKESTPNLVKIHAYDARLANKADLVFTSIRDREGIKRSIKRINKWDKTLNPDGVDGMIEGWLAWAERADFIQTYREAQDLPKLVSRYIAFLGHDISQESVLNQLTEEMQDPGEKYIDTHDKKTLLHYKHKSGW